MQNLHFPAEDDKTLCRRFKWIQPCLATLSRGMFPIFVFALSQGEAITRTRFRSSGGYS